MDASDERNPPSSQGTAQSRGSERGPDFYQSQDFSQDTRSQQERRPLQSPFMSLQREMSRWIDDMVRAFPANLPAGKPSLDLHESGEELCAIVDLPGVAAADIDVRVDDNTLIVAARRQDDVERERQGYRMTERRQGFLQRTVRLPFTPDPDLVRASYRQGVLTVHIPKRGQKLPGRKVAVESTDDTASPVTTTATPAGTAATRAATTSAPASTDTTLGGSSPPEPRNLAS